MSTAIYRWVHSASLPEAHVVDESQIRTTQTALCEQVAPEPLYTWVLGLSGKPRCRRCASLLGGIGATRVNSARRARVKEKK